MISIDTRTQAYFNKLIAQESEPDLGLRLQVFKPGTSDANCDISFQPEAEVASDDISYDFDGFKLFIKELDADYLRDTKIQLEGEGLNMQLKIIAPHIKTQEPDTDASLEDKVKYLLDSEINPALAQHRGACQLVEITANNEVVLKFGGGCHGCGMVDVTLKQGIEHKIKEQFPEITAVLDGTDHSTGTNPYC